MKRFLLIITASLSLFSCQNGLNVRIDSANNHKLNSLFTFEIGENTIFLQDYFLHPEAIQSVNSSSNELELQLSKDKLQLQINASSEVEGFVNIAVQTTDGEFSIPCRRSDKLPYTFEFDPQGRSYKNVQIVGQMNDWTSKFTPDLSLNDSNKYTLRFMLNPGRYQYQIVLDGVKQQDLSNPHFIGDGIGHTNSYFEVKDNYDKYPWLQTDKHEAGKIYLKGKNLTGKVFAYWQNVRLDKDRVKMNGDGIEISIPAVASKKERSFIRVWAENEFGCSNDILVPLQGNQVVSTIQNVQKTDHHSQIMYFVLVDRFKNGKTANDRPLNHPQVDKRVDFWGGDLAGIQQKVEDGYFEKLGVNTLWISPVNQNPDSPHGYYEPTQTKFSGYHGYWPISSSKVDDRFGGANDFKAMVKSSHDKNMNVLLDLVANHVHEQHPLYREHPEYATNLYLPDGSLNVMKWDDERLTTWFDTFMPSLDFSNPEVVDMMTDSAIYWMKEFNLDGFRHDACKHINLEFWRVLTLKMKKSFPDQLPYQVGETYGSPGLIASYLTSGMLDGQFDFNLYDVANNSFAGLQGVDLSSVNRIMQSSFRNYGVHNLMCNISGNHDKPRFMALASGDLNPSEDSKLVGWTRPVGISDSTAYDKLFLFQAFNMTIPGIPVVFYGDEIGMTGANDPDCRRMMRFDNLNTREANLLSKVSTITHARKHSLALLYGDFTNLYLNGNQWVFARKYFDQYALVLINNSATKVSLEIEIPDELNIENKRALFGVKFRVNGNRLKVELDPYTMELIQ